MNASLIIRTLHKYSARRRFEINVQNNLHNHYLITTPNPNASPRASSLGTYRYLNLNIQFRFDTIAQFIFSLNINASFICLLCARRQYRFRCWNTRQQCCARISPRSSSISALLHNLPLSKKNEGCTILFLRLRNYKQGFDLTMSSLFTMTADLDCHKFQSNLGHFQGSLRHLGGY